MIVHGKPSRTVWLHPSQPSIIQVIDQRHLPFAWVIEDLSTVDQVATAIKDMHIRGAGCIGAVAGYGMYLAAIEASHDATPDAHLDRSAQKLVATRPTAVNLAWAVHRQLRALADQPDPAQKISTALTIATEIADEDVACCRAIGQHGLALIRDIAARKAPGEPVRILTHCNAGWLAFVDYGSATAPIYTAFEQGIPLHIWVDETRPRSQGARLTAWELGQHGVPHAIIPDNSGGHLMQHGLVDMVIVGSDRTTRCGDVANKIGTYLKALAARDNGVPFYVALPSSTLDWTMRDGVQEIPVEERDATEITHVEGWDGHRVTTVRVVPENSPAINHGFDVTPARLVTGLITERGISPASEEGLLQLYPEHRTE